jgi:hypothetical protein
MRRVNINKQIKSQWITLVISKSNEKLKFLTRYIKERTVSTELLITVTIKKIYHQVINLAKRMYYDKQISDSVNKKNVGLHKKLTGQVRKKI